MPRSLLEALSSPKQWVAGSLGLISQAQEAMNVTATEAVCCGIIACNLVVLLVAAMMFGTGGPGEGSEDVFDDHTWANADQMSRNPMNVIAVDELASPISMEMRKNEKTD